MVELLLIVVCFNVCPGTLPSTSTQTHICVAPFPLPFDPPAESFVQWSPQGNYIATMHRKGVALWGGPGYARLQRYSHDDVKLIEFSPAERYLMTYSQIRPNSPHEKLQLLLNVFETRSGKKLRFFQGNLDEYAGEQLCQGPGYNARGLGFKGDRVPHGAACV